MSTTCRHYTPPHLPPHLDSETVVHEMNFLRRIPDPSQATRARSTGPSTSSLLDEQTVHGNEIACPDSLILTPLNDATIITLSVDRVFPSNTPNSWDLAEIFAYAVAYGLYLTLSMIALVIIIKETTFFEDKFGVRLTTFFPIDTNNGQMHPIIYLQVAIISQAPIFVTRSHGFFMERPSFALMGAFCLAQLVSTIIAVYADCGLAGIEGISGGRVGFVWVWVCSSSPAVSNMALTLIFKTSPGSSRSTWSSSP
ncbi:unnamed protein product [Peniophora sp. CBMAI 1063]|nr:unnamed protein product [Peniophora sp. CBMAI 1063]